MPNILFCSNNIAHWPTAVAGSVVGTFDSSRVPYSIALTSFETLNSPAFTPSTGDDTWIHFRLFFDGAPFNGTIPLCQAYDPNGALLFRISKDTGTSANQLASVLYDGDTSITNLASILLTADKVNSIDISYKATTLVLELRVYVNGSLAQTLTLASNPNDYEAPDRFSIGCAFTATTNDKMPISEIIVADGDTRNARLDLLRPDSAGALEQWLGSVTVLADDDTTTGMTTVAADQRQTAGLTAYGGASNVSNFVVVSQTTRGNNSPTKIKHTVRLSGVNYDTADIPLPLSLQYNVSDFQINPGTSLPWVGSDLSAIETGFISIA